MAAVQGFRATKWRVEMPESQNSLQNSLLAGNWRGDRRDQHCVASQAVAQPQIVYSEIREEPAKLGLFQISSPSLHPKFLQSKRENVDSLRLRIEIFPFLGDGGRRLGSIYTAWCGAQSHLALERL
jgi:hypothetical protein